MLKIVLTGRKLKRLLSERRKRLLTGLILFLTLPSVGLTAANASQLEKEQIQALIPLTVAAIKAERYDDAVRTAAPLIGLFPKEPKAYELMVSALWGKQDMKGIIQTVLAAENMGVKSSLLYSRMAEAFFLTGRPDTALAALARYEKTWKEENA